MEEFIHASNESNNRQHATAPVVEGSSKTFDRTMHRFARLRVMSALSDKLGHSHDDMSAAIKEILGLDVTREDTTPMKDEDIDKVIGVFTRMSQQAILTENTTADTTDMASEMDPGVNSEASEPIATDTKLNAKAAEPKSVVPEVEVPDINHANAITSAISGVMQMHLDPAVPCDGWIGTMPVSMVKLNHKLDIRRSRKISKKHTLIQEERSKFFQVNDSITVAYCPGDQELHGSVLDGYYRLMFAIREGHTSIRVRFVAVNNLSDAYLRALELRIGTGMPMTSTEKRIAAMRLRAADLTEASVGSLLAVNQSTVHRWWNPATIVEPTGTHSAIKTKLKGVMKNLSKPTAIDWMDITRTLRAVITECENAMDTAEDVVPIDEDAPEAHAA
ncbi:MAG: hypothetical protein HQM09_21525 [Candidatus Riflebacteria bacterium]|nr:hypothetical protein [Candidatus Riflebacteria bacterium]